MKRKKSKRQAARDHADNVVTRVGIFGSAVGRVRALLTRAHLAGQEYARLNAKAKKESPDAR